MIFVSANFVQLCPGVKQYLLRRDDELDHHVYLAIYNARSLNQTTVRWYICQSTWAHYPDSVNQFRSS